MLRLLSCVALGAVAVASLPDDAVSQPQRWISPPVKIRIPKAFYAHLQPGSLRVRTGDRVRRGDVVGLVGNSGN